MANWLVQKIIDDLLAFAIIGGFVLFVVAGLLSQMKGRKISLKDCFEWIKEKLSYEEEIK